MFWSLIGRLLQFQMLGRGHRRARTRAVGPESVKETGAGADQVTQTIIDFLAPMEARLTVIEELSRVTTPPPPEGPAVAQSDPAVV